MRSHDEKRRCALPSASMLSFGIAFLLFFSLPIFADGGAGRFDQRGDKDKFSAWKGQQTTATFTRCTNI